MSLPDNLNQIYLQKIRELLCKEWDPIGVAEFSDESDEYDAYVQDVFNLLVNEPTVDSLFDYLWNLETEYMGLIGVRTNTKKFANLLFELSKEIRAKLDE